MWRECLTVGPGAQAAKLYSGSASVVPVWIGSACNFGGSKIFGDGWNHFFIFATEGAERHAGQLRVYPRKAHLLHTSLFETHGNGLRERGFRVFGMSVLRFREH